MSKIMTKEVVPGKLWITYDDKGDKSGTLKPANNGYIQYMVDGTMVEHSDLSAFKIKEKEVAVDTQDSVFGYPIPNATPQNIQTVDNIPCYTKTEKSKVLFTAGYYCICFDNGGWLPSFGPKLATLQKYPHAGPFKTEADMMLTLKRKQK